MPQSFWFAQRLTPLYLQILLTIDISDVTVDQKYLAREDIELLRGTHIRTGTSSCSRPADV